MNQNDYKEIPWKKIIELIRKRKDNPELLSEMKDEAAWDMATRRFMNEGKKVGLAAGIVKGKKAGIIEGKKAGLAEGEKKGVINIARALLDILDDKTIAKKTKLTVATIKKLRGEK